MPAKFEFARRAKIWQDHARIMPEFWHKNFATNCKCHQIGQLGISWQSSYARILARLQWHHLARSCCPFGPYGKPQRRRVNHDHGACTATRSIPQTTQSLLDQSFDSFHNPVSPVIMPDFALASQPSGASPRTCTLHAHLPARAYCTLTLTHTCTCILQTATSPPPSASAVFQSVHSC